jgi:hypothetical protein
MRDEPREVGLDREAILRPTNSPRVQMVGRRSPRASLSRPTTVTEPLSLIPCPSSLVPHSTRTAAQ